MSPIKYCARKTHKIHMYYPGVHSVILILFKTTQKKNLLCDKEDPFFLFKYGNALQLFVKLLIPYVAL